MKDDNYNCPSCHVTSKGAHRTRKLLSVPQLMILHLKRFRQVGTSYGKNRGMVFLPQTFNILQKRYQICAVVNHSGPSMDSGHYTADLLVDSLNWKRCDDAVVKQWKRLDYHSSEAYLVFCKQM